MTLLQQELLQVLHRIPSENSHHDPLAPLHLSSSDITPAGLPLREDLLDLGQSTLFDSLVETEDLRRLDEPSLLSIGESSLGVREFRHRLFFSRGVDLLLGLEEGDGKRGGKEDEVSFSFGLVREEDEVLMETDLLEPSLTALEVLDGLFEVSIELRGNKTGRRRRSELLRRRKERKTKVDSNSPS